MIDMIEALRIILSKTANPNTQRQAIACLQAVRNNSPVAQIRYNQVVQMAFYEALDLTPEERAIIAGALDVDGGDTRDQVLRVRLTASEMASVKDAARDAGKTVSEYVRSKLF